MTGPWMTGYLHAVLDYAAEFAEVAFFGFFFAGILQAVTSPALITRYLSGSLWRANLVGATAGFVAPLCCCTAIPTAVSLWRRGSRAGPACAFLIATPWFNWYALVALWVLLGWRAALAVSVAAVLTGFAAGVAVDLTGARRARAPLTPVTEGAPGSATPACCDSAAPCATAPSGLDGGPYFDFSAPAQKIRAAWRNTVDLGRELLPWITAGILLGAAVQRLMPGDWLHHHLAGHGWLAPLAALGVAAVLYTDSLGALPMIAALLAKGLGVGSAMILLVAGVGTNPSTLGPVAREMGGGVAIVYVGSVVIITFALGVAWNHLALL